MVDENPGVFRVIGWHDHHVHPSALEGRLQERYGYTKAKAQPKPDDAAKRLAESAKTRKRSATPLTGGGQQGSASATIDEAAKMSLADFSRLKPGEIDALIADAMES